jgi:anti-sigma factor RsiW
VYRCEDVLAELSAFVDDELPVEVRQHIEEHLRTCITCRVLIDTTRRTLKIVADGQAFEVPDVVSERLIERVIAKLR